MLLGARVLSAADDTVAVWSARTSLARGQQVTADDLTSVRVRFAVSTTADRYVAATDELPEGVTLTRDVAPGELVPRDALGEGADTALVEVPLAVEAAGMPSSVTVGSRVDVWVTPTDSGPLAGRSSAGSGAAGTSGGRGGDAEPAEAVRVLSGVSVLADGSGGSSATGFGGDLLPVVVGVPPSAQDDLPRVLAQLTDGAVVLVRRQG